MEGGLHQHAEVIPILLQELELERGGQRIGGDPRLGLRLEAPHDEATDLLFDVGVPVGVTQNGQVRVHPRNGFGHDVEVLGRVEGHVDPAEEADRLRPLTGAVHDDLGLNDPPVRDHARDPAGAGDDVRDARALGDAHAPHAGAAGQRRRHVDRIDGAVARQPEGAEQIADLQNGVALPSLHRRQQFTLEVVGLCGGRRPAELDQSLGRPGHRHPTTPLETGGETGLGLELAVEAGRILHQSGPGLGRPELAEEACRVPRRAARQLPLFEEDDVAPPAAGQVIGGRGPDDTAADDHHTGTIGQICLRRCTFHGRPFPHEPGFSLPVSRRPGAARGRARRRWPRPGGTFPSPSPRSRSRSRWCRPGWTPTASIRTAT